MGGGLIFGLVRGEGEYIPWWADETGELLLYALLSSTWKSKNTSEPRKGWLHTATAICQGRHEF